MSLYRLNWSVEDGYVGRNRPQSTEFDSEDYMDQEEWDKLSEEEKQSYFDEAVFNDFELKVNYSLNNVEEI